MGSETASSAILERLGFGDDETLNLRTPEIVE